MLKLVGSRFGRACPSASFISCTAASLTDSLSGLNTDRTESVRYSPNKQHAMIVINDFEEDYDNSLIFVDLLNRSRIRICKAEWKPLLHAYWLSNDVISVITWNENGHFIHFVYKFGIEEGNVQLELIQKTSLLTSDISLKDQSGAVFVYFNGGDCSNTNGTGIYKYRLIPSYGVSIWWMLPQLLCMALVEALLTVSANEFAYSQTVPSMRSFIQALWLLTSAFGSIFGLVLNQFGLSVSTKCIVYSVAMIATTTIFAFTSRTYNYVTIDNATSPQQNEEESATNSEE